MKNYWTLSVGIVLLATGITLGGRYLLTEREKEAQYPADLGPETIPTYDYTPTQRANYKLFLHKCSICHTPARVINSPYITEKEWKKYIGLMHNLSHKSWLWGEDRTWIREFLVYDAQIRKTEHREAFLRQQQELQAQFRRVLDMRNADEEEERHENP